MAQIMPIIYEINSINICVNIEDVIDAILLCNWIQIHIHFESVS